MPEGAKEAARVQLCGTFAAELSGQRIDNLLPGRQGRLLFAYLALSRLRPLSRSTLIDALWAEDQPADAGGALNALISKTRSVVGGDVLRGRSELILELPEPAYVDVEVALSMLHAAESAVAVGAWRRAWLPARSALLVAQRPFLPWGKPFTFDAETATAVVADHFAITEVINWDMHAVRLPDAAAVALFLRGRGLSEDEASRQAGRWNTPMTVTKRGCLIWARRR
jgi:hypothetical protein